MRKSLCILSLSVPIQKDGRVLRQIEYLSEHYDLTVIGYGEAKFTQVNVRWLPIDRHDTLVRKAIDYLLLFLGRFVPALYELWFWSRPRYKQVKQYLAELQPDGILADDWAVNVLAVSTTPGIPVLFDIHEYWPLEGAPNRLWLLFFAPMIRYLMHKYAPRAAATTTISPPIGKRYSEEMGIHPTMVYSAPKSIDIPERETDPANIQLSFHGSATRNRHLETMIEAVAMADARFKMTFILVDPGDGYIQELKDIANKLAPERIFFRDPVAPPQIAATIAIYDIGMILIAPTTYNNLMIMPNKLFENIVAGNAVCIGPSPAMVELVKQYGIGCISPSFEAGDLAKTLNALTIEDIRRMRAAARQAALTLNADSETGKFVRIFDQLTNRQQETRP